MERFKKHKAQLDEKLGDQRENYTKVVLHKQMMVPTTYQKSEKEIEIQEHPQNKNRNSSPQNLTARESPGLVQRRVLEMSQQPSLSRKCSRNSPSHSPKRSPNTRRSYNSPKRAQIEPSKLLYAPRPFSRQDSSKILKTSELNNGAVKPPNFQTVKSPNFQTGKTQHFQKKSNYKKPAVPPKPRNVVVKPRNSSKLKRTIDNFHRQQQTKDDHGEQNDSGLSEEADDTFIEITPMRNCSFSSLSQKIDDQRFDLLKRRQSYSEFEDLIEKKRELRERMLSKIMLLREERDLLMEEKIENDQFGKEIAHNLESLPAKSSELDKFRHFLEEIEQITKLTVSLTIRLSRLTNKMESGSLSEEEIATHQKKKSRLSDQLNEAELLHQNTDRRAAVVRQMLAKYLSDTSLKQYDNFLVNLIKHITDLKETEQRIQLGEEQLVALNDNLISLP